MYFFYYFKKITEHEKAKEKHAKVHRVQTEKESGWTKWGNIGAICQKRPPSTKLLFFQQSGICARVDIILHILQIMLAQK